ncbi:MAG: hypothetical protein Q8M06_02835, partial [Methanobacteriaceae archaeon]|nr:hypothetical protein [Methanobacteriaceae archaeon]
QNPENKIIFLNVGWMKNYQGLKKGDTINGGGSYVAEMGYGHEILNFLPKNGYCFGYVQSPSIKIDRIGFSDNKNFIEGVLAIWVATDPSGGTYIVGWYKNATIYRQYQHDPDLNRIYDGDELAYNIKANSDDCNLITPDKRVFMLPRGKRGLGRANIWYADHEENKEFRKAVLNYVNNNTLPPLIKKHSKTKNGFPRQHDFYKRQKIEKIAIDKTIEFYQNMVILFSL